MHRYQGYIYIPLSTSCPKPSLNHLKSFSPYTIQCDKIKSLSHHLGSIFATNSLKSPLYTYISNIKPTVGIQAH